jgi:hypothetical protein
MPLLAERASNGHTPEAYACTQRETRPGQISLLTLCQIRLYAAKTCILLVNIDTIGEEGCNENNRGAKPSLD